ncbi:hypothetical protein HD553DRAFT_312544 [Filobasidium floriforme]|uniref:uncharacterized protein n=1 Tax=Filobasidium floriforme TaxID=5210 RepID=UPI001E8E53EF|nr:uncharacterized protein HD553DRAFT_312544 [Filobasidium floriforme]KAH8083506.1 hypothetical protein HD553DRAFT_312544 [Filobasidium floriforme]
MSGRASGSTRNALEEDVTMVDDFDVSNRNGSTAELANTAIAAGARRRAADREQDEANKRARRSVTTRKQVQDDDQDYEDDDADAEKEKKKAEAKKKKDEKAKTQKKAELTPEEQSAIRLTDLRLLGTGGSLNECELNWTQGMVERAFAGATLRNTELWIKTADKQVAVLEKLYTPEMTAMRLQEIECRKTEAANRSRLLDMIENQSKPNQVALLTKLLTLEKS